MTLNEDGSSSCHSANKALTYVYDKQSIALIGYGVTGKACAEFLLNKGAKISVFDKSFDVLIRKTESLTFCPLISNVNLSAFDLVVVSPGVNLNQEFLQTYIKEYGQAHRVIGDIELFARELNVSNARLTEAQLATQVIAVTGSNGKSTVVDMLTQVLRDQGLNVVLGGNFGTSALSLISQSNSQGNSSRANVIVLELSSFQLESTYSLRPDIACILNVSSDHLDRHGNMDEYIRTKQKIYSHARNIIFNRDDKATYPACTSKSISFGSSKCKSVQTECFYQTQAGIYHNEDLILDATNFAEISQFKMANMQVVLACAAILKLDNNKALFTLLNYKGLAHRFETHYQNANTTWINDSKATNPGASIVAIESLASQVNYLVLIAGGDSKGADMQALGEVIEKHVDMLILLGKDAELFTHFNTPFQKAVSMQHAVELANITISKLDSNKRIEKSKIGILLSPACASIDMFKNYQDRGDIFCEAVTAQVAA
jgi:UDP-N-acetylmuramoylalanine--D-glutamate ligase